MPLSLLAELLLTISFRTCAGDEPGAPCRTRAATPATCGAAIDVPLSVAVAVSFVKYDERIAEPGAKTSTTEPKFENDARASVRVLAPTVIASPTRAGDEFAA